MNRLPVRKTHKLFVGGEFPRSESGRSYPALDNRGEVAARVAAASRKDLREAVRAARAAQPGWAGRSGYNRGQILYRAAEMLEDRKPALTEQVRIGGMSRHRAERQVDIAIDRLVWYAGWADKFAQVFGNLNPVSGPFFNISAPEPTGVVGIVAPEEPSLLGLVSRTAPAVVSGNTAVVLASERWPIPAAAFAEALATGDLPAGVINILTGPRGETAPHLASHLDVNALDAYGAPPEMTEMLEREAAAGVKRVVGPPPELPNWNGSRAQSPYFIAAFTEIKTVWHPKGR